MLRALVPRAYIDLNREAYEFDPRMFACELPGYMNTSSPRVAGGLGTIPRAGGRRRGNLPRAAEPRAMPWRRVETIYRPYHRTLNALLDEVLAQDRQRAADRLPFHAVKRHELMSPRRTRPRWMSSSVIAIERLLPEPKSPSFVEDLLRAHGLRVVRNKPYAGGFITQNYGSPAPRPQCPADRNQPRRSTWTKRRFEKNAELLPLCRQLLGQDH